LQSATVLRIRPLSPPGRLQPSSRRPIVRRAHRVRSAKRCLDRSHRRHTPDRRRAKACRPPPTSTSNAHRLIIVGPAPNHLTARKSYGKVARRDAAVGFGLEARLGIELSSRFDVVSSSHRVSNPKWRSCEDRPISAAGGRVTATDDRGVRSGEESGRSVQSVATGFRARLFASRPRSTRGGRTTVTHDVWVVVDCPSHVSVHRHRRQYSAVGPVPRRDAGSA